jgi:hypothetical protein
MRRRVSPGTPNDPRFLYRFPWGDPIGRSNGCSRPPEFCLPGQASGATYAGAGAVARSAISGRQEAKGQEIMSGRRRCAEPANKGPPAVVPECRVLDGGIIPPAVDVDPPPPSHPGARGGATSGVLLPLSVQTWMAAPRPVMTDHGHCAAKRVAGRPECSNGMGSAV